MVYPNSVFLLVGRLFGILSCFLLTCPDSRTHTKNTKMSSQPLRFLFALFTAAAMLQPVAADAGDVIAGILGAGKKSIHLISS